MPSIFDKPYDPKAVEPEIYEKWEKSGFFAPEKLPGKRAKTFTIAIPPPNVTGTLHMGHALNATIQDILIRKKRMEGYKALWIPGTDHAGIATQNVVEKELKKEGKTRHDLGREEFLKRAWAWKEKYGDIILDQLKKLGSSCDWSRTRFTMDAGYVKAVEAAFSHYQKKGWIYQGERTINWCSRCATSLSDLEIQYQEEDAEWYEIKYGPLVIGTVRPETKLGDTAVAVNPKDRRYKKYIGRELEIDTVLGPAKVKVIPDPEVDMKFGTGAMKVTPAHDLHDFELAEKYGLEKLKVIGPDGRMTELAGKYRGLKTKEAREQIVKDLEAKGLLVSRKPYRHKVTVCYRCGTTLEPILSKQWFLKMSAKGGSALGGDGLAEIAIKAVKSGKIKFHPKKWEKVYLDWLGNIKDWCVSRQIWWGHKIPVWYCVGAHLKTEKKMGFAGDVVPQLFLDKIRTYRLRDHEFQVGDRVAFENSQTGEIFGYGTITEIKKTTVGKINLKDPKHHRVYNTREELIAAFKRHPQLVKEVTEHTPAWLYTYRFQPIDKSERCIQVNPKIKGNWFFVRHGETDFNKEQRIQGQTGGAPLNENGKKQAYDAAARLKPYNIDLIISSDLARAKETAEIIAKELGAEVILDKSLRERNYGILEGLTRGEIADKGLQEVLDNLGNYHHAPPEGENFPQMEKRIFEAFAKHKKEHIHKNIVIVSHGSILKSLLRKLKNVPFESFKDVTIHNADVLHFSVADPCKKCGSDLVEQDTNVLDTWFSSALWPFAILGWPEKTKDLEIYYPTQVLSTARDIINLWVARMVFSSEELLGKPPFKDVIIHATIMAKSGKRMSKSLGTGVDPMDLIDQYGADATRFGLIWQAMGTQDIKWAEEHVVAGRKFCNKIWNATRFVLQSAARGKTLGVFGDSTPSVKERAADKKILRELAKTKKEVNQRIEKYEFGQTLHILHDFFWHKFCDQYLEESKKNLNAEVLLLVLADSLKLLHPFMPFITERIWQELNKENLLMIESWPKV